MRRGFRWTFLGFAVSRGLGMLTTLLLAHFLVPGDFGVVTFGLVLITVARYLFTLGIAPAIIIRQDLDRPALGTALTLLVAAHLAVIAAVSAASPLAARFLDSPNSTRIILAMTIPLLCGGVAEFYDALLQRELEFVRDFVAGAGQVVILSVVALVAAASGAGAWSLVLGQVAGQLVLTVLVVVLAPFRVRPRWDRYVAWSLWRDGRGFALQGLASFVEQNADYFVVGSTMGAGPLGLYGLGYRISEIPYNAIVEPISQVTFPGFARLRARGQSATEAFLSTLRLITLCAVPLGVILAAAATPFVHALLNSRWDGLTTVLPILAVWGAVRAIQGTIGWFVNSLGFSNRVGVSYGVMLVGSVPLLVVSAQAFGLRGVASTMLLDVVVMLVIVGRIAGRDAGVPYRAQWEAVRPSVLASLPTALCVRGMAVALSGRAPALVLVLTAGAGVAVYGAVVALLSPGLLSHGAQQLARVAHPVDVDSGSEAAGATDPLLPLVVPDHPDPV